MTTCVCQRDRGDYSLAQPGAGSPRDAAAAAAAAAASTPAAAAAATAPTTAAAAAATAATAASAGILHTLSRRAGGFLVEDEERPQVDVSELFLVERDMRIERGII